MTEEQKIAAYAKHGVTLGKPKEDVKEETKKEKKR